MQFQATTCRSAFYSDAAGDAPPCLPCCNAHCRRAPSLAPACVCRPLFCPALRCFTGVRLYAAAPYRVTGRTLSGFRLADARAFRMPLVALFALRHDLPPSA
jgi:hypothetical protein